MLSHLPISRAGPRQEVEMAVMTVGQTRRVRAGDPGKSTKRGRKTRVDMTDMTDVT